MAEGKAPPPEHDRTADSLGVLLLGRTGRGKSTTGNKLLEAGCKSMLQYGVQPFAIGGEGVSCTHKIRSEFRRKTELAQAIVVTDTPGFADSAKAGKGGVYRANLAMIRDIIRNQVNHKLRIHRVLYFLPCRGPLEIADAHVQEEIEVMHHFFGNAIFDCMVLIATRDEEAQICGFSEKATERTKNAFQKVLELASIVGKPLECPPVIFIGLEDLGLDVLRKIESADVVSNEGLILNKLRRGTCLRCASRFLCHQCKPNDSENRIGIAVPFKDDKQDDEEKYFPYHSSDCHPLFIPKYSFWEKVVGSAAHVATLGIPLIVHKLTNQELPWPTFASNDEMCAKCRKSPGSEGCLEVGTTYEATLPTGKTVNITVDHTNLMEGDISNHLDVSRNGTI